MKLFFIVTLTILALIFAIYSIYYISTLPERRKNKERMKREVLLYEEKCQAEKAKQIARTAGKITRENIDKISKQK